ncbi:carbohydrate porin [Shimia abyssi]|uniref:Porin n=1 Tax=Shimia abyssi TaxID=1662395 RepID=A0A2P8FIN9_9RHOB|nr:carbohydrate porin [Shimia abyssi]PSL21580.1 porin [Shimia abyssi]
MKTRLCAFLGMVLCAASGGAWAQSGGLNGPSSVAADLAPGDGLTDPQFRSDFPQNVVPGWFAWKDGLAGNGFKFNLDYLSLGLSSDGSTGDAAGGIARLYGSWQATENGSLTFKIENRHGYGSPDPQNMLLGQGILSIPGTAFNDNGSLLTNLYWTQRAEDGAWTFQIGQIDVTDFLSIYGLVSPYTAFQNLAFNTNPTISAPDQGLGMAFGARLGKNAYVVASVADAMGDPSEPDFDVFDHRRLFKSVEIGYTSGFDRIYFDNVHLTLWHTDGKAAEDYGAAFSGAWFIDNKWMPFLRAGTSKATEALYKNTVSGGIGYFGRNTDLGGVGLNWSEAANGQEQMTAEVFYRFSVSPGLQITPSMQFIHDPIGSTTGRDITLFGLRARMVF